LIVTAPIVLPAQFTIICGEIGVFAGSDAARRERTRCLLVPNGAGSDRKAIAGQIENPA
jgi:hypothetical protein